MPPPSVERTGGNVAEVFGVGPGVETAVERFAALSAGVKETTLQLGSRVVGILEESNFLIISIPGLGAKVRCALQ